MGQSVVAGSPIADGLLVVRGERIVALGSALEPPADATVVDAQGLHLYPGFIHPSTSLGLTEIGSVRGTVDSTEIGDSNAGLRTEVAFHPDSQLLWPAIAGGVLTAHVVARGELFAGTSALLYLAGWTAEQMTVKAPVGLHLYFPAVVRPTRAPGPPGTLEKEDDFDGLRDKALARLDERIAQARAYLKARDAAATGGAAPVAMNPALEPFRALLAGDLPLFLHASEKTQIERALDWALRHHLKRLVLVAGSDVQFVAARLAAEQVPVILDGVLELPTRRWQPYDSAYVAAARLHAAGVRFAIGDGGGASNARNLPFHAGMAAAFGLSPDLALRSVTLSAAEILGVADRLGSLEVGKEATFFLATGDPLEPRTQIRRVWQAGSELDLARDRQRQLYERYRERPGAVRSDLK